MKTLFACALLLLLVGVVQIARGAVVSNQPDNVYLPSLRIDVSPTPTTTPTSSPTPSPTPTVTPVPTATLIPLVWTERAMEPSWIYPVMGGAVINGTLYVVGVYPTYDYGDGGLHATTYDPATDTWTVRPGHSASGVCCVQGTGVGATNGKIYLVAMDSSFMPTMYEYSPSSDSWQTRAAIPTAISSAGFSLVGGTDGKVYAVGGSLLYAFDPGKNSWSAGTPPPIAISSPSLAATTDGKIYAFGQGIGEVYNIATLTWSTIQPVAIVSNLMGAAQAGDGKIYLVGGPLGPNGIPWTIVDVYDPATDSWATQTNLLWGDQAPIVLVLNNTDLYVVGGFNGENDDQRMEEAAIP